MMAEKVWTQEEVSQLIRENNEHLAEVKKQAHKSGQTTGLLIGALLIAPLFYAAMHGLFGGSECRNIDPHNEPPASGDYRSGQ